MIFMKILMIIWVVNVFLKKNHLEKILRSVLPVKSLSRSLLTRLYLMGYSSEYDSSFNMRLRFECIDRGIITDLSMIK